MSARTCRVCGDAVWWARTVGGSAIAMDPDPTSDGNFVIRTRLSSGAIVGQVSRHVSAAPTLPGLEFTVDEDTPRYKAHAATCPRVPRHHSARDRLQLIPGGAP